MNRAPPAPMRADVAEWPGLLSSVFSGRATRRGERHYEGRPRVKGFPGHHLLAARDDGPEPGSRWSAPRTNDLDVGEDRRGMERVVVAVHQQRVGATGHLFGRVP